MGRPRRIRVTDPGRCLGGRPEEGWDCDWLLCWVSPCPSGEYKGNDAAVSGVVCKSLVHILAHILFEKCQFLYTTWQSDRVGLVAVYPS